MCEGIGPCDGIKLPARKRASTSEALDSLVPGTASPTRDGSVSGCALRAAWPSSVYKRLEVNLHARGLGGLARVLFSPLLTWRVIPFRGHNTRHRHPPWIRAKGGGRHSNYFTARAGAQRKGASVDAACSTRGRRQLRGTQLSGGRWWNCRPTGSPKVQAILQVGLEMKSRRDRPLSSSRDNNNKGANDPRQEVAWGSDSKSSERAPSACACSRAASFASAIGVARAVRATRRRKATPASCGARSPGNTGLPASRVRRRVVVAHAGTVALEQHWAGAAV